MKFVSRNIGNYPIVEIPGHSVDYILTSRYFEIYTRDGEHTVHACSNGSVKVQNEADRGTDGGMLIGWIRE